MYHPEDFLMLCTYANIVNLDRDNTVVNSFITNPVFRFISFYQNFDDPSIDKGLPTLYVGYKETKKRFEVNILTPKFADLSWWCASPSEDPMRFLKGFQEFLFLIPPALVENLKTLRTDPVFGPAKNAKELLALFQEQGIRVTYLRKNSYNIFTKTGLVLILDAVLYRTYGVNTEKLKEYLKEASLHFHDDENDAVFHFFTNRFEYDPSEVTKYIPYLIWLKAKGGENKQPDSVESKQTIKT